MVKVAGFLNKIYQSWKIRPRWNWNYFHIGNFNQLLCQTYDRASNLPECLCCSAETSSYDPFLFFFLLKVLPSLRLVAIHFTANSYSFEALLLFIISLLWGAALLLSYATYFCFKADFSWNG